MEEALEKVKSLSKDSGFISKLEQDQIKEYERRVALEQEKKEIRDEALSEGKQIGLDEGKQLRNIEVAKNLLKDNIDIESISKYTGLSIEEINTLD